MPSPGRFREIDGCFNFRDLGGYRAGDGWTVPWRRLYRADGLHRFSAGGRAAFGALGIVSVLDLRTGDEAGQCPWTPPDGWPGRRSHLPLLAGVPDWSGGDPGELNRDDFAAGHYLHIAEEGAAELGRAVRLLAEPGALPAVFHCSAGKDRTGVLAALVLRLLGVPAGAVADDYALSERATARWEASVAGGVPDDTLSTWATVPPSLLRSDRETMLAFLRGIDERYGSVAGWAAARLGIGAADAERLRRAL
ncbi:tyrosine-protein phosphatase [Streptomyces sp. CAU 1734]